MYFGPFGNISKTKLRNWILLSLWIFLQIYFFINTFRFHLISSRYKTARSIMGSWSLSLARASAYIINLNCAVILLSMCRMTITKLWHFKWINALIGFENNKFVHYVVGYSIIAFSILHCAAHFINFRNFNEWFNIQFPSNLPGFFSSVAVEMALVDPTGLTGQVAIICLFLLATSSIFKKIRRLSFEVFWNTHHLGIIFLVVVCLHGLFCFVKTDLPGPECRGASSFKYILPGLALYIFERVYREFRLRRRTELSRIVYHPSKVVELQFKKPSMKYKTGQYLFVVCPRLSRIQYHPFTITSAPEEDYISIHIRISGNWTTRLAQLVGVDTDLPFAVAASTMTLPNIMIDGPYGSAAQDIMNYSVVILIGAGIGQTPFASILKSLWFQAKSNRKNVPRKVYFYGICRETTSFEWFHDILSVLEEEDPINMFNISCYLTGALKRHQIDDIMMNDIQGECDAITGLKTPTHYGRPKFETILPRIKDWHPNTKIGVFYCGPKGLADKLETLTNDFSGRGTTFAFHKEQF